MRRAEDLEVLTGFGNAAPGPSHVLDPTSVDELARCLELAGEPAGAERGLIARGLGRSYGDPAQNSGGLVARTTAVRGIRRLDLEAGLVVAAAGTSLDDLMRWLVPLGWFVPVTPGTRQVTVGGAIASDIHGKNHHRVGSWCNWVESITLVTPADGRVEVSPTDRPELFWATAGGMGLTGMILEATIRLTPIESAYLSVDTDRTPDLDTTLDLMESGDHAYDYSVAWVDIMTRGRAMGRSILSRGGFAPRAQLDARRMRDPLRFRSGTLGTFPARPAVRLVNPLTIQAFNEAWYRKAPRRDRARLQTISQFFHPLDMVHEWNRVYGRTGLLQWQCAVPLDATDDLRWIVEQLSASGCSSFLNVLKRFGPGNPGPLSFPMEGWTLAIDVPTVGLAGLGDLLDRLDRRVVDVGGRLYLAKDSRMDPALLAAMYPRLDEWRKVRATVDPEGVLNSDLARRLALRD
jgi:decaprenylphospho-beta-D-ribofuranose 2-oxidase